MIPLLRFAIVLALSVLLLACANVPPTVNGSLVPPAGLAYVVISATYDAGQDGGNNGEAGVEIIGPDQKKIIVASSAGNNEIQGPTEQENAKGGLHLLSLPPGEYRILRAFGSYQESGFEFGFGMSRGSAYSGVGMGVGASTGGKRFHFAVPLKAVFQLKAGEVLYIGNAHITLERIPSATISSQIPRDFNHMQKVWKVTDFSTVQIRPVQEEK